MHLFNTNKSKRKPRAWFAALLLSLLLHSSCVGIGLYVIRGGGGPHAGHSKEYILGDTVALVGDASLANAMVMGSTAPTVGWVYLTVAVILYANNTSDNL